MVAGSPLQASQDGRNAIRPYGNLGQRGGGCSRKIWRREFLIVEIRLLHDNRVPVRGPINIQRSTIERLGRRLMVGQVPLEHFV